MATEGAPAQPVPGEPQSMSVDGTSEDEIGGADGAASTSAAGKAKHRRTRNGCLICRRRKKLCDENKPVCGACRRLNLPCEYEDRVQAALERRKRRIERMKTAEKQQGGRTNLPGTQAEPSGPTAADWNAVQLLDRQGQDHHGYNPIHPAYSASPAASTPSLPLPLPPPVASAEVGGAPSGSSWVPFLGSFAPAGYEPAAAPDPLAWTTSWPHSFGYPPFSAGPPYPMPPYAALEAPPVFAPEDVAGRAPIEQDPAQLDLDALARLEDVQSDIVLRAQGLPTTAEGAAFPSPTGSSPPFDLFALLRSPSPVHPFSSSTVGAAAANLSVPINIPAQQQQPQQLTATTGETERRPQSAHQGRLQVGNKALPSTVGHAASLLASSDWAFTQAYLLSHYTSSLARLVSITSSPSSSGDSSSGSDRSRSRRSRLSLQQAHYPSRSASSHSRPRDAATARSTRASANLFLSLVPLANRHPFLLHAILSWSAANLAAASTNSNASGQPSGAGSGDAPQPQQQGGHHAAAGGNSVMATLSDQLGHLADSEISAALPELEAYAARRAQHPAETVAHGAASDSPPANWEVLLAARLMLTQAAICQGAVDLWRVRLGEAAHVVNLVGGVQKCRSPLARQLVKNLLYHDVLSSTSRRDGLLLDYSALRHGSVGATPGSTQSGTSPATGGASSTEGGTPAQAEDDEDDVLDTLMGCAESVFLLVGRITSLAKEKRQALLSSHGGVAEDELASFMRQVDELRTELEREKERMDAFLVERPDLEPHRYFHEVFRLAALVYLEMLLELPPTSYPILLLVRKMLSLTEVIVSEDLPGLCSMHWPLFLMHLNSTPLVSPHSTGQSPRPPTASTSASSAAASVPGPSDAPAAAAAAAGGRSNSMIPPHSDRARSTALFDAHMHEFTFMNTKRSRALIDEAWRRSEGGRRFVDPDEILGEWRWDLNWA